MSDDAVTGTDHGRRLAVVVVAGGRGRRMGGQDLGDKASVIVGGEPLLSTVLRRLSDAESKHAPAESQGIGSRMAQGNEPSATAPDHVQQRVRVELGPVVVVGPAHLASLIPDALLDRATVVQEQPPGGGPLAGVAAGLGALDSERHGTVAVIGGDMLDIGAALGSLQDALVNSRSDVAVLVDSADRVQHLGAVWRTSQLLDRLTRFGSLTDRRLADLYDSASLVRVPDTAGWSRDIDSPGDVTG